MVQTFELPNFDEKSIARLTNSHRVAMAKVVLSFARLDTQLSNWLVEAYEMRADRAALLIQHMAIDNKYLRLIRLYKHEGPAVWAKELKKAKDEMEPHADVRNTICHAACVGTWTGDRDYILFAPLTCEIGKPNTARIEAISVQSMATASEWAEVQAGSMIHIWKQLERARSRR